MRRAASRMVGCGREEPRLVGGRLVWPRGRRERGEAVHGAWDVRRRMVAGRLQPVRREGRGGPPVAGSWEERPRMVAGRILRPGRPEYRAFMADNPGVRCNADM